MKDTLYVGDRVELIGYRGKYGTVVEGKGRNFYIDVVAVVWDKAGYYSKDYPYSCPSRSNLRKLSKLEKALC